MTKIEVSKAVRDAFPELRISYFTATQLRPQLRSANAEKLLDAAIADIQALNIQGEAIGQLPLLSPWRAAFARQGVKPAKFRPSAEALFRRFASGRYVSVGNALIDAYNAVSARFQVPIGAYDQEKIQSTISVRHLGVGDQFSPLGANPSDYFLDSKIVGYVSGPTVMCWSFNHRDSQLTCIGEETDKALIVAESIDVSQHESRKAAISEMREWLGAWGVNISEIQEAV